MDLQKRRVAVVGATASGKTSLAIDIARAVGGEVVSCDSMSVYRRLDIGTAKPTPEQTKDVPHHLIDVADPRTSFSCGDYALLAKAAAADIEGRGRAVIYCGGTGLYLEAALSDGRDAQSVSKDDLNGAKDSFNGARDDGYRESLRPLGCERLMEMLRRTDPEAAAAIDPHNAVRIIRALEINHVAHMTKGQWDALSRRVMPESVAVVCVDVPRGVLYSRIEARVDEMMAAGLEHEVRSLYAEGMLPENGGGARAIGYKELLPYVRGEISLGDAVRELKTATRHYAKRQLTWFHAKDYVRFFADADSAFGFAVGFLRR